MELETEISLMYIKAVGYSGFVLAIHQVPAVQLAFVFKSVGVRQVAEFALWWTEMELHKAEVVQVKVILVVGVVLDGHKLGADGEKALVILPCGRGGGYFITPNEGVGCVGRCGITYLEGLGIVAQIIPIRE